MEPYDAPLFFKTKYFDPYNPKTPDAGGKNAAHVKYIGTRIGVQLEEQTESVDHVRYIDKRPGSHGLFSSLAAGTVDLKDVQKEMAEHSGIVWRWTLSLRELDAKRLNLTTREAWEDTMRQAVPLAAEKMGIPETRLRWVAAMHQKKNRFGEQQPHVHIVLWEVPPHRRNGRFHKTGVERVLSKHIYAAEEEELNALRTKARNQIRQRTKAETLAAVDRLLGKECVTELPAEELRELACIVREVERALPTKGKVAYKLLPPAVKEVVNQSVDKLLALPTWFRMVGEMKLSVHVQASKHRKSHEEWHESWLKSEAYRKLMPDMANRLLQAALALRKGQRDANRKQEEALVQEFRSAALSAVNGGRTPEAMEMARIVKDVERMIPPKGAFVFARLPKATQAEVLSLVDCSYVGRDMPVWPRIRMRLARALMWPALQWRVRRMQRESDVDRAVGVVFSALDTVKEKELRKAEREKDREEEAY